jgi:cell wall-associated NlpC family hydrolase
MPVVLKYLGTPYVFGANSDRAVDCSAFVQQVLADLGLKVPRTSREQWAFFPATTRPVQGDLVFFSFGGKQIDHVGIYLGRNVFVHANSYESRVVIESLDAPTYKRVYRGSRSTNLGQVLAVSNGH